MEVRSYGETEAFTTKDGSTIRELLGLPTSPLIRNQSLAEATLRPGQATERHYHTESEELYYLVADPSELQSLHADPAYADLLAAMRDRAATLCAPPPPGYVI